MASMKLEPAVKSMDDQLSITSSLHLPVSPTRLTYGLVFFAVFSAAIAFAFFTNHAWEDYYITFRSSKNLAAGNGLVFTVGEKVHTFTSPLGVLIPAGISAASGNGSDTLTLWVFRCLSSLALATAAVLLLRMARACSFSAVPSLVLLGMFGLDAKILDFSINGMETALMTVFLAFILKTLIMPGSFAALQLGTAWAGLMWTRPDAFVYIGALALGFFVFHPTCYSGGSRTDLLRLFLKSGVIALILYLPWVFWTWSYYGSPIPHTVIAKGLRMKVNGWRIATGVFTYPIGTLLFPKSFDAAFLPPYALMGGWPHWLAWYSRALGWICAFYWCIPRGGPRIRAVSLAFMLVSTYLDLVAPFPFPWYLASGTILACIVCGAIPQQLGFSSRPGQLWGRILAVGASGALLGITLGLTLCCGYQLRIQQREVEDGNRKEIGLWLRRQSPAGTETVFLEPLGYIGYFSQLKMLDFPGLSSPEVVAARRKLDTDDASRLIRELGPDWLVLRPSEVQSINHNDSQLLNQVYSQIKRFDVSDRIKSYRWLPGRTYLELDQAFIVYRHRRSTDPGLIMK